VALVIEKSPVVAQILLLSPVAQIIQDARYTLVTHNGTTTLYQLVHNPFIVAIPFVLVGLSVVVAGYFFRKNAKYFAENI
jgi:ABC-2 type transport system permease protein